MLQTPATFLPLIVPRASGDRGTDDVWVTATNFSTRGVPSETLLRLNTVTGLRDRKSVV